MVNLEIVKNRESMIVRNIRNNNAYLLNSSATFFLNKIINEIDMEDICKELANKYKISIADAETDFGALAVELEREGLIKINE